MNAGPRRSIPPDVAVLAAWTALAVLVATVPVVRESALRVVVAGTYLLFAPGYALVAALFVRDGQVSPLERAVFGVGASLALVGLVGLVLAVSPAIGLDLQTVLASQVLVVGGSLAVATHRRRTVEPADRATPSAAVVASLRRAWAGRSAVGGGSRIVQVAVVLATATAVGATVFVVATPLPSEQYTEFYVTGVDGSEATIPETVGPDGAVELRVGTTNHEHETVDYATQVQVRPEEGDPVVIDTASYTLGHGESHEQSVSVRPVGEGTVDVEILLFAGEPPGTVVDPETADRYVSVTATVEDG